MSRFADPAAVDRFVLGPCDCEGTPHDEDWIDLRAQLSGLELITIESAGLVERIRLIAVAWNLLDGETVAAIDEAHISRLSLPTLNRIGEWWSERAARYALPNG